MRASQKDLSYSIRERKIKRLLKTEADIVLAACPFCELQIDEGLRKTEDSSHDPATRDRSDLEPPAKTDRIVRRWRPCWSPVGSVRKS